MKKIRLICALLLAMLLCGCVPRQELSAEPAALPTPLPGSIPSAPRSMEPVTFQVQALLWHPDDTGSMLTLKPRTLSAQTEAGLYTAALEAMLTTGADHFSRDIALTCVEPMGAGQVVVEMTLPADMPEKDILTLLLCCTNTLGSLDAEGVSFMLNGRAARIQGWPVGVLIPGDTDITAFWARCIAESSQNTCTRRALIFRAAADGQYIAPEVAEITLTRDQEITALLEALRSESTLPGASSAFPADQRALLQAPVWAGEGMVSLHFDANLLAMLESEGIQSWQMYAATACTCLAFLGQVEGVEIHVSNAQVVRMEPDLFFEDGTMHWQDFASVRARSVRLYFSDGNGGLVAKPRFCTDDQAASPQWLLTALMAGPTPLEADACTPAPHELPEKWLLGVTVEGQEARVSLSPALRTACRSFTPHQERSMVYAMVNTLSQLRGVSRVRFYVGSDTPETFLQEISFLSPLRENLGLVRIP